MQRHTTLVFTLAIALAIILAAAGFAGAGPLARPLLQGGAPTVVSCQGQVTVASAPYTGDGYFKFAVVDQAGATSFWSNNGTLAGGGQPTNAIKLGVSNGLFNVLLGDSALPNMIALPASAFAGTGRYLRVWFSSDNINFTQLAPDRRIAAVPYALQAEEAKTAATAGDADTLDTLHASAFQQHYQGVKVVAKSGGDYTTVTAALDSISDASDSNRYLIKVMPGVYSERVTMKPFVDIEGAGELTTKITYTGGTDFHTATVVGANDTELRLLTVENTRESGSAVAIYNGSASPRLTQVTATASGIETDSIGVNNFNASPTMTHVTATASGTKQTFGVYNDSSSSTMMNVTATASGGTNSYGVINYSSSPTMTNVTATASGATTTNYGVTNYNSSPTIQSSIISAGGTSGTRRGVGCSASGGACTVLVNNSQITGATNSIRGNSYFTIRIGASQLSGGAVDANGGTVTCAGVYDEDYVFYASTCP